VRNPYPNANVKPRKQIVYESRRQMEAWSWTMDLVVDFPCLPIVTFSTPFFFSLQFSFVQFIFGWS
jgi:hypothetical protein